MSTGTSTTAPVATDVTPIEIGSGFAPEWNPARGRSTTTTRQDENQTHGGNTSPH